MQPGAECLTSLCLGFSICEMRAVTELPSRAGWEDYLSSDDVKVTCKCHGEWVASRSPVIKRNIMTFSPLPSRSAHPSPFINECVSRACSVPRCKGHDKEHERQGPSLSELRAYQERHETTFESQEGEAQGRRLREPS